MKESIREMIHKSGKDFSKMKDRDLRIHIMDSLNRYCSTGSSGGLGNGEAEESASSTTPDSGHRRVDQADPGSREKMLQDNGICRVVGFIPLSRRSKSGLPPGWNLW